MNKLHYGIALILFTTVFSSFVLILPRNQARPLQANDKQKTVSDTEPLILNVTTNLGCGWMIPDNYSVNFDAIVENASTCFLSYSLDKVNWTNQTMTKIGDRYSTILNTSAIPWLTEVYYRICAKDTYEHSNETEISEFQIFNDP